MAAPRQINVFSVGDARQLKTWSNVPYFFTKSLEEKGIAVNRVNIEESAALSAIYKYSIYILLKLLSRDIGHTYFRSGLNHYFTRKKIGRALRKHKNAEANIFLTFSFSAAGLPEAAGKPVLLFGDWTYLYYIRNFLKREPCWFEKDALKREQLNIEAASQVLALFPLSAVFIKANYANHNCHYLGNVINANHSLNKEAITRQKASSRKILFIGNKKYLSGAQQLIAAFGKLKTRDNTAELHLVGLTEQETGTSLPGLFHHGYLDKGDAAQNETYYTLVTQAAVIVNTQDGWGSFSALTEAMYYFTPVITTPYKEFTETYGSQPGFGFYNSGHDVAALAQAILNVLEMPAAERLQLMESAHDAVKDFTWKAYTDKVLALLPSR